MAGRYTSKVRTSEYMDTPTVVPGLIMSAGMARAGQPSVIPMRVAPELELVSKNPDVSGASELELVAPELKLVSKKP